MKVKCVNDRTVYHYRLQLVYAQGCLCTSVLMCLQTCVLPPLSTSVCVCVYGWRVCFVFVSLGLCTPAKPPVPEPHLWSPGRWLIWKYNHAGQDFISSLHQSPSSSISIPAFISTASLSLGRHCTVMVHKSLTTLGDPFKQPEPQWITAHLPKLKWRLSHR